MAMKIMADNNEVISAAQDAALYNALAAGNDFIIGGIGNEMAFSHNTTSLTATLGSGECVICGRHVTITGSETINIPYSTSGYIVLRYDLSQSGSNICKLMNVTSLRTDNLNDSGTIHDLVIGQYTTNATGVTSFTDMRKVLTGIPASKVGTATVGGTAKPIYLSAGTPKALTANVGSANQLVYLLSGAIVAGITIRSGTSAPSASLGSDGDIYIQYEA